MEQFSNKLDSNATKGNADSLLHGSCKFSFSLYLYIPFAANACLSLFLRPCVFPWKFPFSPLIFHSIWRARLHLSIYLAMHVSMYGNQSSKKAWPYITNSLRLFSIPFAVHVCMQINQQCTSLFLFFSVCDNIG